MGSFCYDSSVSRDCDSWNVSAVHGSGDGSGSFRGLDQVIWCDVSCGHRYHACGLLSSPSADRRRDSYCDFCVSLRDARRHHPSTYTNGFFDHLLFLLFRSSCAHHAVSLHRRPSHARRVVFPAFRLYRAPHDSSAVSCYSADQTCHRAYLWQSKTPAPAWPLTLLPRAASLTEPSTPRPLWLVVLRYACLCRG